MTEAITIAIIVSVPPTVAAICSVVVVMKNTIKLNEVHVEVKSKLVDTLAKIDDLKDDLKKEQNREDK